MQEVLKILLVQYELQEFCVIIITNNLLVRIQIWSWIIFLWCCFCKNCYITIAKSFIMQADSNVYEKYKLQQNDKFQAISSIRNKTWLDIKSGLVSIFLSVIKLAKISFTHISFLLLIFESLFWLNNQNKYFSLLSRLTMLNVWQSIVIEFWNC